MLTQYLALTAQLLQNPQAPTTLYTTANLTTYINIARGQIAAEGRCVRRVGTIPTIVGTRKYSFSSITFTASEVTGTINVRNIAYSSGTGQIYVAPLPFEWFWLYNLNTNAPASGPPSSWAQHQQGASGVSITSGGSPDSSGTFYVDPLPDNIYTLQCDCVCYPVPLVLDADTEALPYLWTDAVPYYAAYMALLASQTSARLEQAQRLYQLYQNFVQRARAFSNPDVLAMQYSQSPGLGLTTAVTPPQGATRQ